MASTAFTTFCVLHPDVRLTIDIPTGYPVLVNGLPGYIAWHPNGTPLPILVFTITAHQITNIIALTDPAKLITTSLPPPPEEPATR